VSAARVLIALGHNAVASVDFRAYNKAPNSVDLQITVPSYSWDTGYSPAESVSVRITPAQARELIAALEAAMNAEVPND
jgi:hypothetical protein